MCFPPNKTFVQPILSIFNPALFISMFTSSQFLCSPSVSVHCSISWCVISTCRSVEWCGNIGIFIAHDKQVRDSVRKTAPRHYQRSKTPPRIQSVILVQPMSYIYRELKSCPFQWTTMGPYFMKKKSVVVNSERQIITHTIFFNLKRYISK